MFTLSVQYESKPYKGRIFIKTGTTNNDIVPVYKVLYINENGLCENIKLRNGTYCGLTENSYYTNKSSVDFSFYIDDSIDHVEAWL